jgi:hypothetical protein
MTVGHQTSPKLPRFVEFLSAFFSMTQAEYAAGNFKQKATEGQLTARIRVGAGIDNVAGVKLFPSFQSTIRVSLPTTRAWVSSVEERRLSLSVKSLRFFLNYFSSTLLCLL